MGEMPYFLWMNTVFFRSDPMTIERNLLARDRWLSCSFCYLENAFHEKIRIQRNETLRFPKGDSRASKAPIPGDRLMLRKDILSNVKVRQWIVLGSDDDQIILVNYKNERYDLEVVNQNDMRFASERKRLLSLCKRISIVP